MVMYMILQNISPNHIDLFFPNVTPKLLSFFPAWVSTPSLEFISKVMQITLASNGLKLKYVPQFDEKISFTKFLQKCAYFCINEFLNQICKCWAMPFCDDFG